MKKLLIPVLLLLAALPAAAQIFTQGSDPGWLRWYRIDTPNYRIIYPEGADSLALVYGTELERFRPATGRSIGMVPGASNWRGKTPVILHTRNGYSNGSMFCAPYRMDLFTRPDPYGGDPAPWESSLAAHEPRHLAQLQAGYRGVWKPFNYVLGELIPAAVWSMYAGQPLSEGDAVAFETAAIGGSRARTAQFLNYFRVAFDEGDWRDWYRWRYGSFRDYAPDYYKIGYMTVTGMRCFFSAELFMKDYYDRIAARPWGIGNMQKSVRAVTGQSFRESFRTVSERFNALWQAEKAARAPYMPMDTVTTAGSFHTDYYHSLAAGDRLLVLRKGKTRENELLLLGDGKPERIRSFAGSASSLFWDPVRERIYWSETVRDPRWTLSHTSRIRFMNPSDFVAHDLTTGSRLYNPQPSPDGNRIAAVEYPYDGGTAVLILDAGDGTVLRKVTAPDGLQPTESAWDGKQLYVSGLTEGGYGLYRIGDDGSWEMLLHPVPALMQNLGNGEGGIEFVSDRDGREELYRYETASGRLIQRTRTPFGATDFSEKDGFLYYSSQTRGGMMLMRTPLDSLPEREVRYEDLMRHPVEEVLQNQERALAGDEPFTADPEPERFSAPVRYRKLPHLMHFHSWAPVWFNYDRLSQLSFDIDYKTASPGVTGLFQNHLGTAQGYLGYSAHRDPSDRDRWRHSFHGKLTYTGLYPVLEASFDVNDRNTLRYMAGHDLTTKNHFLFSRYGNDPDVSLSLLAYIPWVFDRGGILRGLIPQVRWTGANDTYYTGEVRYATRRFLQGVSGRRNFLEIIPGDRVCSHTVRASLRGYVMRPTPEACTYPRLGVGAEAGLVLRPGTGDVFSPIAFGYAYGYLPGIAPAQGLKLTALLQCRTNPGARIPSITVATYPRGFTSASGLLLAKTAPTQVKLTADYAIPFTFGDISALAPVLYIKNFLLLPHADLAASGGKTLVSAGTDLTAVLGGLAWIPFDTSVGVTVDWKGGSLFPATGEKRLYAGLVFNVDF